MAGKEAELSQNFSVAGLSPRESRRLRDALARVGVVVDVGADDDTVRIAAGRLSSAVSYHLRSR